MQWKGCSGTTNDRCHLWRHHAQLANVDDIQDSENENKTPFDDSTNSEDSTDHDLMAIIIYWNLIYKNYY